MSQKLDADTHNDYLESLKAPREVPKLSEFLDFLERKFTAIESSRRRQEAPKSSHQQQPSTSSSYKHFYKAKQEISKCPHCGNKHQLFTCKAFLELHPDAKRKAVSKYNLCKNCLFEHKSNECYSEKRCKVCNGDHNTLIHDAYGNSPNLATQYNTSAAESKRASNSNLVSQENLSETLLATALIKVAKHDGSQITLRALIDQGSQISLITERAAQMLQLPRERCKGVVFGVGAKQNQFKGVINITCRALHGDYVFKTNAFIMRELMNNLPNKSFTKPAAWTFLENIALADPDFHLSRPVDILLGADIYSNIIQEGIIRHEKMQPVAQQTRLGWILCGNVPSFQCNVVINNVEDIQRFWAVEDIAENSNMSQEDLKCLQHYKSTTTRNEEGRYIVQLPLKPDLEEKLGASKSTALAQFKQLERKFSRQQKLAEAYKIFMEDYQLLNHMVECTSNEKLSCYLPHHCVQRPESTTSPIRVVFNPSAKTTSGYTLNDLMYQGPNLQQDLMFLILRWRQYQFAYTADIEKMYRQILCDKEHQKYQKIIWRSSPDQPLREYQLTTVTYGMKAAPFLAMMTLKQLANNEGHKYPSSRASKALQEEFYMDDLVSGSFTLASAKQLQTDLTAILKSGGFNLRKWSSNKKELLEEVSKAETGHEEFDFKRAESTKTLGLKWHPKEDYFSFQLKINIRPPTEKQTKRTLLSDISKIFDPCGWLSPITIKLKLLFKQVWLCNISWDDQLPSDINKEWEKLRADLQNITKLKIERWYRTNECDNIQLHGFSDATTKNYACVVYCKTGAHITIVAAKTRLTSQNKKLTVPRLELSGAHLLSVLMNKIQQTLSGHQFKTYCWTDSTAVLGWIQGDVNRWTPFVANRVKQIKEVIPPESWRYVKSSENPADCATRGMSTEQLKHHSLWWTGPSFLSNFNEQEEKEIPKYVTDQEERKTKQCNVTTRHSRDDIIPNILNKHSNFTRAVRVLAWVLRFTLHSGTRIPFLTTTELAKAKNIIIKYVQESEFADEICNLKANRQIDNKSKLLSLNPFLDEDGLLKVGGRLKHANISEEMKHPLIVPHSSHLTNLIIDQAHCATFHAGARMTLAYTRQRYWIIGGNRAVKNRLHTCTICKKHKAMKQHQLMGQLPSSRSNPARPFHHTGVDFTGYVDIKLNKGRGAKTTKGYIAVFVCMATKAVHLEIVSDMTTSAFLAALKRMASRRGKPQQMYSDNGTNFVGANRALQREFKKQKTFHEDFWCEINEMGINWSFICPGWPSAGGLWESAVRSLKHHLRRVVGEQKLTFEEYSTLLAQLEACLNSRPLCALTEDPDDLDYLTPSHFLSSGPILTILNTEEDERYRWKRTQSIYKDIWKRWQSEYLSQLTARSKWLRPQENIKLNDVVIINEPNLPAGRWMLGRVTEVHPGADGYVRVVTLKTKSGYIKRPVIKLAILTTNTEPFTPIGTAKTAEQNETNKQDEQSRENKPRKGKLNPKVNFVSIIITLIFSLTTALANQTAYRVTALNKTLYFDRISSMQLTRDEWKLIVYYDLHPYWDGLNTFDKYLQQINKECERGIKKTLCNIILLQLRHTRDEFEYYNKILFNQHFKTSTRKRRGLIDGVGYVANSLFGILDQQFANQYQKDISLIRENQKHLATLWRNQTSVVEAEYNLLKRTEDTINKQHKIINQHLNNLSNAVNSMNKDIIHEELMNELALLGIIANNMLTKLKSIQDTLIDTITDIHHGVYNIHLLSPEQLRNELNIISGQLGRDLSLPTENIQTEIDKIYHLLKVKARATQEYLIFEIKIPLVSRDNYDLYRLLSIPQKIGNKTATIVPVSDYIAINLHKDNYIVLTETDIQQCTRYNERSEICHSAKPIFHFKSEESLCVKDPITDRCHTSISVCRNSWTELKKANTYLYYCCDECTFRIMCDQVTAIRVSKAGVIALEPDCMIKGQDFTVFSHKQRYSEMKTKSNIETEYIAPINHIINLSIPLVAINISNQEAYYNHIKNQIEQMKTENPLVEAISYHDIHQYTAIYILMGGVFTAAAVYTWRCLRRRRARNASLQSDTAPKTQPPNESVRMTNFNFKKETKQARQVLPVFHKASASESD